MDLQYADFRADLARLKKLHTLVAMIHAFRGTSKSADDGTPFIKQAIAIHDALTESLADIVVLSGAMILYLGGRFEFFVRERLEQACDTIAAKAGTFDDLPNAMKENLVSLTAEVMQSPRKYGHAEKGVESFVKILAQNMAATNGVGSVNHRCLSITHENMRPGVVRDLFKRIGFADVWSMACDQAGVKLHFGEMETSRAKNACMKYLDEFMDVRNRIAHPSAGFTWPSLASVGEHITYFEVISEAISLVVGVYEATVPNTIPDPTVGPGAPAAPAASAASPVTASTPTQHVVAPVATPINAVGQPPQGP